MQEDMQLSSRVVSAARQLKDSALGAAKKSKDFVSGKSAKLGEVLSVVKNELLSPSSHSSTTDLEASSTTHIYEPLDTRETLDTLHPGAVVVGTKTEGVVGEGKEEGMEEKEDATGIREQHVFWEEGEDATGLMQFGIREQHVFWGMRDYLLPGGVLAVSVPCLTYPPSTSSATGDGYTEGGWCVGWRKVLVNMPPGLFEDALFRLCNSIEPVSFVLSDLQHPLPTPARVLIYTAAQVVALFLYVFCDDFPGADIVVGIAFSPVVLLVQNWLYYMLHCPCLTNKHGRPNMLGRKGTVLARAMGRILALPVTVGLLFMLVHIAHRIANGKDGDILGLYIANGIVVTFLLLLLLDSMSFWWFAPKLKVQVCGYVLLEVNKWTLERERDEADISWGGGGGADAQCVTIDPCCCCCSCRCCGCNRPPEVAPPEVELVSVEVSVECV